MAYRRCRGGVSRAKRGSGIKKKKKKKKLRASIWRGELRSGIALIMQQAHRGYIYRVAARQRRRASHEISKRQGALAGA